MNTAQFKALRKRVRESVGTAARPVLLRRYLREKARRGEYDRRYFDFFGVDANVTPKLKQAVTRAYAIGLVPTSSTGGQHAPNSFHKQKDANGRGRAVDLGNRTFTPPIIRQKRMLEFQRGEFNRALANRPDWVEVIGPDNNMIILRHGRSPLAEGSALETQHDNHVHIADDS